MDRRSPKGEGGLVVASYGSASHLHFFFLRLPLDGSGR
jgi:hypothetical protein